MEELQICNKCGRALPLSEYYHYKDKDGKSVPKKVCKDCIKKQVNDYWNSLPPEVQRERRRQERERKQMAKSLEKIKKKLELDSKVKLEIEKMKRMGLL